MFGTGPFAVPSFKSLLNSDHDVLALVTRPILDSGKRRKSAENPTRDAGFEAGIRILDPPSANDQDFIGVLRDLKPDLLVVCDYGQILSRQCLATARLGGINLHGSLLPKYRGAAPIQWCIYNGDEVTGVTIIHMTPKLDGGPCLVQEELTIDPDENSEQLEPRLAQLGVQPVHRSIQMLSQWDGVSAIGEIQDPKLATKAPRLKKSDGLVDWNRTASQIRNQIRAFIPWPGTYTHWHSERLKQPMRLIFHSADVWDTDSDLGPGQVVGSENDGLIIQTGSGQLVVRQIQPAGKRAMPVRDFLRGNPPQKGERMLS
ncbi:MAG: methionyl-tRNA formyltransferase [Planctomycetota bacterium]